MHGPIVDKPIASVVYSYSSLGLLLKNLDPDPFMIRIIILSKRVEGIAGQVII
jgi:hypothetical protein